jgi:predicted O-linked N-acetylglucosamine transferase (SPINDLY family)
LKYGGLDQPAAASRMREQFAQRGVAGERIWLEGWSDNLELLSHYQAVDLALDSHPYSGGLTTCEALWMGVPVVTCPGRTFASRHSTSHMMNAGYGQFVAKDLAGYVELAVEWASRVSDLALLRGEMRERVGQSPLCDGVGFARAMLEVVRDAWESKVRSANSPA